MSTKKKNTKAEAKPVTEPERAPTEPQPAVEPVAEVQPDPPVRNRLTAEEIRIAHHLAEWGRK